MAARRARAAAQTAYRRAYVHGRDDPEGQARVAAFVDGLQQLGWTDGRNVRIEIRWTVAIPLTRRNTRRNWSRLRLTSFLLLPA